MCEIKIQLAKNDDFQEIAALSRDLVRYDYKFDQTLNIDWDIASYLQYLMRAERAVILVAKNSSEEVIGYLIATIGEPDESRSLNTLVEIEELFILPEYRRNKISSGLIDYLLEIINENHDEQKTRIMVRVSAKNSGAIEFYQKNEFQMHDVILERNNSPHR
jgi:ribosomal protein S18 acetylase RimI-like enzyme